MREHNNLPIKIRYIDLMDPITGEDVIVDIDEDFQHDFFALEVERNEEYMMEQMRARINAQYIVHDILGLMEELHYPEEVVEEETEIKDNVVQLFPNKED